jgi:hypothetical protein
MHTYLVTYDLRREQRDYEALHKSISDLGAATRVLKSTWVVHSGLRVHEILGNLAKSDVEGNDGFFVAELENTWGRVRLDDESNLQDWLGHPSPIDA